MARTKAKATFSSGRYLVSSSTNVLLTYYTGSWTSSTNLIKTALIAWFDTARYMDNSSPFLSRKSIEAFAKDSFSPMNSSAYSKGPMIIFPLLQELEERFSLFCQPRDEIIESCRHSSEFLNLFGVPRRVQTMYRFNLIRVYFYALVSDLISQEFP